jgi:MFS family permease
MRVALPALVRHPDVLPRLTKFPDCENNARRTPKRPSVEPTGDDNTAVGVNGPNFQARSLAGAVIGSITGISALLLYTNGQFVAGLARDFGLTRVQFGFGVLLATMAIAAANPLVGWLVDRLGAKWPSIGGLVALSAGFAALGAFTGSAGDYFLLQTLLGFIGAASGPIAYTKVIGAAFHARRGVALGITMMGIGLSGWLVPPLLARIIEAHGWRGGYFALAVVPLAGALLTAIVLPRVATPARPVAAAAMAAEPATWLRERTFWILAAAFAAISLSFAGLLPHFVPLLGDAGLDPVTAGVVAGRIGLAVIASRLLIGYLLDRVFAPRIAIAICLIAAAGITLLLLDGVAAASLTAIAMGIALGAELDLMGYLVARYFGLAQFGKIYGWLYGAFVFASGLGPLWVGAVRDAYGSYTPALVVSAVGLVASCAVFLLLPRYAAPATSTR